MASLRKILRKKFTQLSEDELHVYVWSMSGNFEVPISQLIDTLVNFVIKSYSDGGEYENLVDPSNDDTRRSLRLYIKNIVFRDNESSLLAKFRLYPDTLMRYIMTHQDKFDPRIFQDINPRLFGYYTFNTILPSLKIDDNTIIRFNFPYELTNFYIGIKDLVNQEEINLLRNAVNDMKVGTNPTLHNGTKILSHLDRKTIGYRVGGYIIETPPLGIKGVWPYHYVSGFDGVDMKDYFRYWGELYNNETIKTEYGNSARQIMFLIASFRHDGDFISRIKVIRDSNFDSYTFSQKVFKCIINVPFILKYTARNFDLSMEDFKLMIENIIQERNLKYYPLDEVQRHNVIQYLQQHPDIKYDEQPVLNDFPYFIEDYINLNDIPDEVYRNTFPVLNDQPYSNFDTTVKFQVDEEYETPENYASDVGLLWVEGKLDQSEDNKHFDSEFVKYYVINLMNLPVIGMVKFLNHEVLFLISDIVKLGGFGFNVNDANPKLRELIRKTDIMFELSILKNQWQLDIIYKLFSIPLKSIRNLYTYKEFRTILHRGYMHPPPNIESKYLPAAEKWAQLPQVQRDIYFDTHIPSETRNRFDVYNIWYDNVYEPYLKDRFKNPLYYEYVELYNPNDEATCIVMATKLQCYVPINKTVSEYLRDSLINMETFINRDQKPVIDHVNGRELYALSDYEVFDFNGFFINHETYDHLRRMKDILRWNRRFFVPFYRKATNQYYLTLIPPKPELYDDPDYDEYLTSNIETFGIAYGNLEDYILYDLDELIGGFSTSGIRNNVRKLQIITEVGYRDLAEGDAQQLLNLIKSIRDAEIRRGSTFYIQQFDMLIHSLTEAIIYGKYSTIYNNEVKDKFEKIETRDKRLLLPIFNKMFELGMRFRHWKGPGHPYPLSYQSTLSGNVFMTGEANSLSTLVEFNTLLNSIHPDLLQFVRDLRVVNHKDGTIVQDQMLFGYFWDKITGLSAQKEYEAKLEQKIEITKKDLDKLDGNYCIRMASTIMVGTGHYYAEMLFNIRLGSDVPGGYDPKAIAAIT